VKDVGSFKRLKRDESLRALFYLPQKPGGDNQTDNRADDKTIDNWVADIVWHQNCIKNNRRIKRKSGMHRK